MKQHATLLFLFIAQAVLGQSTVYLDKPYQQDYSIKYYLPDSTVRLSALAVDRNGIVSVLGQGRILRPQAGAFLYPGTLQPEKAYKPMLDKHIIQITSYENQFVYLDSLEVFSNAFAGKWYLRHGIAGARFLATGKDFISAVSNGDVIRFFKRDQLIWETHTGITDMLAIKFDSHRDRFIVLSKTSLRSFSLSEKKIQAIYEGQNLTCFDISAKNIFVGTDQGYMVMDASTSKLIRPLDTKLPVPQLSAIALVNGNLWFGSAMGAFMLKNDGGFNYYFGERWLPGNKVISMVAGPEKQVLLLTNKGLGEIHFDPMTLEEKALLYEKQVRLRHIRYGFNCDVSTLTHGDLSTFQMGQHDSDNLWTAMYLGSQIFRYKVTGSQEAYQNCLESFDAMERLFQITGMKGYFARGFERQGYYKFVNKQWDGGMTNGWVHPRDSAWDWRGTTSSDQTVGQMFSLTLAAEHLDGDLKKRAIYLIDQLMTNIIENDWYLIDFDGKPTLWAKWNPEYVNGFPTNVGDRKLNSSNILAFLQTAFHFTGKAIYKQKAYELMSKYGYLENALRPMSQIGQAGTDAADWAKMLSEGWNHSDDEMYFLSYWCLYPYAFTPDLKAKFKTAIQQHWELERPEKDGLWNLCYAMTGAKAFDLNETIWYLKEFPLDMIEWQVMNSHRKDIVFMEPNFRGQTTREVLPPDERPELKHNRNLFNLDRAANGNSELSAGDSFLLPYWMGRFLGAISKGQ